MSQVLTIIRGLPGSGKSTLTNLIGGVDVFAADDFFIDKDGLYNFDPTLLSEAHAHCQNRARESLENGGSAVVTNTFSQRWELEPYLALARKFEIVVFVVDMFDAGCTDEELFERNVHGVPLEGIQAMRARWEHDWKNGDARPPWEREE